MIQKSDWCATVKEKRDNIYTRRFRPPVGRKTEVDAGEKVLGLVVLRVWSCVFFTPSSFPSICPNQNCAERFRSGDLIR